MRELAAADAEVARVVAASPELVGLISDAGPTGDALGTDEFVCGPVDVVTLNPAWLAGSRGTTGTATVAVFA